MSLSTKCLNCGTHHLNTNGFCSSKCEREMVGDVGCAKPYSSSKKNVHSTPKKVDGGGMRFNSGKLPIELVPTSAMYALADVLEYGATKYDDHNWRRGMKWSIPYSCAMRHLLKWFEGEERDEESGKEHLSHVMANIAMLIEFKSTCKELDDRFKGEQRTYDSFQEDNGKEEVNKEMEEMAEYFEPENYSNGRT